MKFLLLEWSCEPPRKPAVLLSAGTHSGKRQSCKLSSMLGIESLAPRTSSVLSMVWTYHRPSRGLFESTSKGKPLEAARVVMSGLVVLNAAMIPN